MLRALVRPAFQSAAILTRNQVKNSAANDFLRKFSQLSIKPEATKFQLPTLCQPPILLQPALIQSPLISQKRGLTKFSLNKGKRKTVKAVLKRFKRLDWGIWIRTIAGKNKRLWKKSQYQRYRARQHVFVNGQQSTLLDKMTTKYWKKPKHWVDDIYQPFQSRESYWATRKKPIEWD